MATLTTLIPAYKHEHLAEVFLGLQRQTFKDFKVVLSDDSPDDEITQRLRSGQFGWLIEGLDLEVLRGPKQARQNHDALMAYWGGETPYAHLHLDDDVIFPDFYRSHVEAHAQGAYSVSVTRRWVTQDDIRPVYGIELPRFIAESPLRAVPVSAEQLFQSMVPTCNNWVGEFSNMVISAAGGRCWPRPPSQGLSYYGWLDVGFLLTAIQTLPMIYVRDHQGIYRQHGQQTTHHMNNLGGRVSSIAWVVTALRAWQESRISAAQCVNAVRYTVGECFKRYGERDEVMNRFFDIVQAHGGQLDEFARVLAPFWCELIAGFRSGGRRAQAEGGVPAPQAVPA